MKSRISLLVAIAAMGFAPLAQGQQYYNQPVPQQIAAPQQVAMPQAAQQPNWNSVAFRNTQQPAMQNAPNLNAANMNANMAGGPGCDAYGNGCAGAGCDGCGGGGCGLGGGLGSRLGGGCGLGNGSGLGGGGYDPCCPTRYFSMYGGAAQFQDLALDISLAAPNVPATDAQGILGTSSGWGLGAAVGRSLGRRFRAEFDFTYRDSTIDSVGLVLPGAPAGSIPLDGRINTYSFMPNLLWDLNPNGRFNAYLGGGAGVSFNDLEAIEPTTPLGVELQGSSFAYQGIVGLSACISQRAELFFEYRYFATDDLELNAAAPIGSAAASVDITSNNYFFGVRIKRW